MCQPLGAEQRLYLYHAFACQQAKVRIDHLYFLAAHADGG